MAKDECLQEQVGLVIVCSALSVSLCFNIMVFLRGISCKDYIRCPRSCGQKRPSQDKRNDSGHEDRLSRENSIYGNFVTDSGSVNNQQPRRNPGKKNVNYASLDLKAMQKRVHGLPNHLPLHLTPAAHSVLEADTTFNLPCRQSREMDSQRTIYLNHLQL